MQAQFYWHALKRYWWLVVLPVVLTIAGLFGLERARGSQYQSTQYFLVSSPYGLSGRDYSRGSGTSPVPSADDQIAGPFDFANLANSFQVAAKTIEDLGLPLESALHLFKPDLLELKPSTVQVSPGQPSGDAASKGLLTELLGTSSGTEKQVQASSRWVQLVVLTYDDPDLAERLARAYARNAVEFFRQTHARIAQESQQQVLKHVDEARKMLDAAETALTGFEEQHKLLSGGSEFQSAQALLDELKQQRVQMVSSIGGREQTEQRLAELDQEIAALEEQVAQQTEALGAASAEFQGQREAAQSRIDAAQTSYSQAAESYTMGEREVSLARAQGFPSTRVTVQTTTSPGSKTTVESSETVPEQTSTTTEVTPAHTSTTTETTPASSSTTTEITPGHTSTTTQTTPRHQTTTTDKTEGHTSTTTVEQTVENPGSKTTVEGDTNTTTTVEASTTTTESTTTTSQPDVKRTTSTEVPETQTTTTSAVPEVKRTTTTTQPETKRTTTSSVPEVTRSVNTTSPESQRTTVSTTTTEPTTNTVTSEEPTQIQSESQAAAYLASLSRSLDGRSAELLAAQQEFVALEANNPTATLANQLEVNREKLNALRSTRSALVRMDADPVAGLKELDQQIAQQQQRIGYLTSISTQYRRLTNDVERARLDYLEMLKLADRYARLRQDAVLSAGVQIAGEPYTMKLPSKLGTTLAFGILIAMMFGVSVAFGFAYIVHVRSLGGPGTTPQGGTPEPAAPDEIATKLEEIYQVPAAPAGAPPSPGQNHSTPAPTDSSSPSHS